VSLPAELGTPAFGPAAADFGVAAVGVADK